MMIERIVAGVELAAYKPAVKRQITAVKDLVPAFGPNNILRRFTPKSFRIVDGTLECFLIRIGHVALLFAWIGIFDSYDRVGGEGEIGGRSGIYRTLSP